MSDWQIIGSRRTLFVSAVGGAPPPPEWQIIGSRITLFVAVVSLPPPEWQIIGPTIPLPVSVKPPPGWQIIGPRLTLFVSSGEIPPECAVDTDCPLGYVCQNGVCVSEKEKFPWGAAALIGGGLLLVAASAKPEKGKSLTKIK